MKKTRSAGHFYIKREEDIEIRGNKAKLYSIMHHSGKLGEIIQGSNLFDFREKIKESIGFITGDKTDENAENIAEICNKMKIGDEIKFSFVCTHNKIRNMHCVINKSKQLKFTDHDRFTNQSDDLSSFFAGLGAYVLVGSILDYSHYKNNDSISEMSQASSGSSISSTYRYNPSNDSSNSSDSSNSDSGSSISDSSSSGFDGGYSGGFDGGGCGGF